MEHFADPSVHKSMEVDLALVDHYDALVTDLELTIVREAKRHDADAFHRLRSVRASARSCPDDPLRDSRHHALRSCAGVCVLRRLVKCPKESAGKKLGTGGAKMGNVHLKWAFSEAAVMFLRHTRDGKKLLAASRRNTAKAKRCRSSRTRSGAPCTTCCREAPSFRRRSSSRRSGKGAGEPDV